MQKKRKKAWIILTCFLSIPVIMWLIWLGTPKTKMVAAIIDKTVLTPEGQEHISLTWVLNHQKFTKTSTKPYQISHDYFGFFPQDKERFKLKGLERFTSDQLEQLAEDADMVYFTDTYGIYKNEWYSQQNNTERSGIIYGGMSTQDISLLKKMKEKNKLIITEFNSIGSPTHYGTRQEFEKMFALKWSGWTGRYFENLDTSKNQELPQWLIRNYKNTHNGEWPFKKAGVAFVSENDQVVVLENDRHLTNPLPHIISTDYGKEKLGLPAKIKYAFWFDVVVPDPKVNKSVADFKLDVNTKGFQELKKHGLSASFPAVTLHNEHDYRFYYFSGDFCDNPISMTTSYFKGIEFFKWMFYNTDNPMERSSFFWNFYRPMLTSILKDEQTRRSK